MGKNDSNFLRRGVVSIPLVVISLLSIVFSAFLVNTQLNPNQRFTFSPRAAITEGEISPTTATKCSIFVKCEGNQQCFAPGTSPKAGTCNPTDETTLVKVENGQMGCPTTWRASQKVGKCGVECTSQTCGTGKTCKDYKCVTSSVPPPVDGESSSPPSTNCTFLRTDTNKTVSGNCHDPSKLKCTKTSCGGVPNAQGTCTSPNKCYEEPTFTNNGWIETTSTGGTTGGTTGTATLNVNSKLTTGGALAGFNIGYVDGNTPSGTTNYPIKNTSTFIHGTLQANLSQTVGGTAYVFDHWEPANFPFKPITGDFIGCQSIGGTKNERCAVDVAQTKTETIYAVYKVGTASTCPTKKDGDANCDTKIDLVDYEIWRQESRTEATTKTADFNADSKVDAADLTIWKANKS